MKLKTLIYLAALFPSVSMAMAIDTESPNKIVKLASLDWEPYIGQSLKNLGLINEILTAAFKAEGYKLELSFVPWARAIEDSKIGLYDGYMPEYMDETRKSDFVFSESFFDGPVGFLIIESNKKFQNSYQNNGDLDKTYAKLKDFKFGVVRDYINEEKFDKNKNGLKKEEASSDEINLKKLDAGRIEAIFIDKYVANFFVEKLFPNTQGKFKFMEPALQKNKLYIAFSKKVPNYQLKLDAFNKGFAEINKNGTLKKIIDSNSYFK